ncbi:MAG: RNA 2',3'-cyclic phosphodiesterase [Planctomycetota bacterium]
MATRSFIALNLDAPVRTALARIAGEIDQPPGCRIRWTAKENLHVTVKFLGEVRDSILPEVCRVAREAAKRVAPFTFGIYGVVSVPPQSPRPRMLWAGVHDPEQRIAGIFHDLEEGLSALGFGRDRRGFRPHVTLARIRRVSDPRELRQCARTWQDTSFGQIRAEALTVFASDLMSDGPVYTSLASMPLKG